MRTLLIPKKEINQIKKLMNNEKVEYGGWFEFVGVNPKYSKRKQFKGDGLSVSVPTENYELHWHTHPKYLISSGSLNQTGPFQPPSIDDIAQSSYKYFAFPMGELLKQIVFTHHAIYIQEPIKSVLDNFFKTKMLTLKNDKEIKIWTNKWYTPFKKEMSKIRNKMSSIGLDLGGYIHDETGKHVFYSDELNAEMYKDSLKLEKEYFDMANKYGVKITKIPNWKKVSKEGLEIKINV